ncbi:MAG: hypothetical protein ACO3JL_21650, partial [Myxococcota bacterium]
MEASRLDRLQEFEAVGLRPGDIVEFHQVQDWARLTHLTHSAVYVGNGLFFEKPATEGPNEDNKVTCQVRDETPFRLVTLDMMARLIDNALSGSYRVEAWRPAAPLKEAAEAFASSLTGRIKAYAEARGAVLNLPLVGEFEQGMAGTISGEHASALVKKPLRQNDEGTTSFA